jgi:CHAT domain-containing protein
VALACAAPLGPRFRGMGEAGAYAKMIELYERKFPYGTSDRGILLSVCEAYYETRTYEKFEDCSTALIAAYGSEPKYRPEIGGLHVRRARALLDVGERSGALQEATRAIEVLEEAREASWIDTVYVDVDLIEAYGVAGLTYALQGERERADAYIPRIERVKRTVADEDVAKARHIAIARIHVAFGRFVEARQVMESYDWKQPLDIFLNVVMAVAAAESGSGYYGGTNPTASSKYVTLPKAFLLGKIYYETGDPRARQFYDALLEDPVTASSGGIHLWTLHDRGEIALAEGDSARGIDLLKRSVEVIESQRASFGSDTEKIGFVGDKQLVYVDLVTALVEASREEEAFAYAERAKARALVDLLAHKRRFRRGPRPESARLTRLVAGLERSEAQARSDPTAARTRSMRSRQAELEQADPELASLVTVQPPDVAELMGLVPAGETLIEYFGAGDALFAFVVTRQTVRVAVLSGKGMDGLVGSFRAAIALRGSDRYRAPGLELYRHLIEPIEPWIVGTDLTIVPHGSLHYLPFDALYTGSDHLVDRYAMRVLPSASVMKFLRRHEQGHTGPMLVFGNPDLGDQELDLPFAEQEARTVAATQEGAEVLVGALATETAVKQFGGERRVLHFATHGRFDPDAPMQSGLLMAADEENDGVLSVAELFDLRLDADLVTLSACETALGRLTSGDDVVGFVRGFLYAGANTIIASLWSVDDEATAVLMKYFYEGRGRTDARRALRLAQLEVKQRYEHPYFWAAFQVIGRASSIVSHGQGEVRSRVPIRATDRRAVQPDPVAAL